MKNLTKIKELIYADVDGLRIKLHDELRSLFPLVEEVDQWMDGDKERTAVSQIPSDMEKLLLGSIGKKNCLGIGFEGCDIHELIKASKKLLEWQKMFLED